MILDYTEDGLVVGIEILHASKTLAAGPWTKWRQPGDDDEAVQAAE